MERLTKRNKELKVREAAAVYHVGRGEEGAVSTISSKNQITLPAHMLRELGLGPGDRLAVNREGNRLVLRARPRDWVKYHGGGLAGLYGGSREEIDAYIRDLRDDAERDEALERAWSGTEPAPER
jgi:AbrB family looped-hinge helix DNA binding protein